MPTLSIINQLHTAVRNPTALLLGGACGALVPLGTSYVTHELLAGELAQRSILPLLVFGGVVFSSLSVYAFARTVFGSWYKALGFVVALEGYMTFTTGAHRLMQQDWQRSLNRFICSGLKIRLQVNCRKGCD